MASLNPRASALDDQMIILKDEAVDGPVVDLPLIDLESWKARGHDPAAVGVRLDSHQQADAIGEDAHRLALIALTFPKFTDGRAYTTARLLREAYGYTGELRATGDVLIDQYAFMRMAGFDAVEADGADAERWSAAARRIGGWYQDISNARDPSLFPAINRARRAP